MLASAADFAALKGSVETVNIAGSWRGRVTMDLSDAHAFGQFSINDKPTVCVGQRRFDRACRSNVPNP